mmetsp:Transcript_36942/g.85896  ORF Transcript_36942/g.85896 Transcript_36942/m.85896 type:complete len:278 (-) Transcript_36942:58-891(-)
MGHDIIVPDAESTTRDGLSYEVGTVPILERELNEDPYHLGNLNLRPGDVVADIGANIGLTSVLLAKMFPGIRVISEEPIPEVFFLLKETIRLNNLSDSIVPVQSAITSDAREMSFAFVGDMSVMSMDVAVHERLYGAHALVQARSTQTMTLRGLMHRFNVSYLALVKLDCEGCEFEAMLDLPQDKIGTIRAEVHGRYRPDMAAWVRMIDTFTSWWRAFPPKSFWRSAGCVAGDTEAVAVFGGGSITEYCSSWAAHQRPNPPLIGSGTWECCNRINHT